MALQPPSDRVPSLAKDIVALGELACIAASRDARGLSCIAVSGDRVSSALFADVASPLATPVAAGLAVSGVGDVTPEACSQGEARDLDEDT